ncbi:hypothetical protein C0Q70_09671 [Pomacea canaliculata]|uniref:Uncharacterized protein n=1 Tax=Pomacea canaliculata TaxID=400727 RepID=A0A2T7PAF0_POMCA|nr:hypothetical protein C0Q70_09671 [Pomacea canaliculata]
MVWAFTAVTAVVCTEELRTVVCRGAVCHRHHVPASHGVELLRFPGVNACIAGVVKDRKWNRCSASWAYVSTPVAGVR